MPPPDDRTRHGRKTPVGQRVATPEPAPAAASAATILVVEDNPITRKMVRVALEAESYAVLEAGDGSTALEIVSRQAPDLILQDLVLPDLSGFDLVERLHAQPGCAGVPVIAFTGFLTLADQARATAAGFTCLLTKPVDPSRLIQTIKQLLVPVTVPVAASGPRVLVADDEPVQLRLARALLTSRGFVVTTAADGAEALELARHDPPDAIISDVLMPAWTASTCALRCGPIRAWRTFRSSW